MFHNKLLLRILSLIVLVATGATVFALAGGIKQAVSYSAVSEKIDTIEDCSFFELELPENAVVYGLHTDKSVILPHIIDDTNQAAREIDLVVNSPQQPVVLFLATYNPSIWDIQWTAGTKILGVVAFGYHTQAVAGLPKETPILTNTYEDCSAEIAFYSYLARPSSGSPVKEKFTLEEFSTKLFGQPSENYTFHSQSYSPNESIYFFGELPEEDTVLLSSDDTPVESFFVTAPRMGSLGIKDALKEGTLKQATKEDYVNWVEANIRAKKQAYGDKWSTAEQQAYQTKLMSHYPEEFEDAYVVLKDFTFPPESRGAFFIPEGVPLPKRDPSGSSIYALDTGKCFNYCPGFPYGDITVLDYPEQD